MIDKRCGSIADAVVDVFDGAVLMISGFGESGVPGELIEGLLEQRASGLTIIANNAGSGDQGVAALFKEGRVRRIVCSYPRSRGSTWFERCYEAGRVDLEVVAQGTLSERIRAGGAGIPAFYTPTAAGTELAEMKEARVVSGRDCILEYALHADFALIKARSGDRWGNLVYHATARNYAPTMAMAASVTIAQVDRIVPLGSLDPEAIVTPGIFVQRLVCPNQAEGGFA